MNLIISAMEDELIQTILTLQPSKIIKYDNIKLYQKGTWLFAITHIGLVNAAVALTTLINDYAIKKIYNFGTVGSLKSAIQPLTTTVVIKSYYTYADARGFGYHMGQIPGEPPFFHSNEILTKQIEEISLGCEKVILGSSDVFIDKPEYLDHIEKNFKNHIDIVDMEGNAFFQVAYKHAIPIVSVKIVSDYIKTTKTPAIQFNENLKYASIIIRDLIVKLVDYKKI